MSDAAIPALVLRAAVRRRRAWPAAWLLLAPSLALLAAFTYWPVAQVAWRSLVVQRFGAPADYGLGNYARLFQDPHFIQAAENTTLYGLGTVLPSLVIALLFALALQRSTRLNAVLRTIVVLPLLIPLVAAGALFIFIFLPGEGLLDHYLGRLGAAGPNWLGDPDVALGSIIAITVWKNTGYYMLFFLAGLAGVPEELIEAAQLEGAGGWTRFWAVILPLLGPTFAFVLVIAILNVLVQIDHVATMTQGGPSDSTNMLLYYIYQQAEQNYDPGLASAATVVSVAGLLALTVASLGRLERGLHYES